VSIPANTYLATGTANVTTTVEIYHRKVGGDLVATSGDMWRQVATSSTIKEGQNVQKQPTFLGSRVHAV